MSGGLTVRWYGLAPFFVNARIVAIKYALYLRDVGKLADKDGYNCGPNGADCKRFGEKNVRAGRANRTKFGPYYFGLGCPGCLLNEKWEIEFLEVLNALVKKRGGWRKGWPLNRMLGVFITVRHMLHDSKDRILPGWDLFLAEAAAVWKSAAAEVSNNKDMSLSDY